MCDALTRTSLISLSLPLPRTALPTNPRTQNAAPSNSVSKFRIRYLSELPPLPPSSFIPLHCPPPRPLHSSPVPLPTSCVSACRVPVLNSVLFCSSSFFFAFPPRLPCSVVSCFISTQTLPTSIPSPPLPLSLSLCRASCPKRRLPFSVLFFSFCLPLSDCIHASHLPPHHPTPT